MRNVTKRTAAVVVSMAVAVGAASVAYAYWTAGGSGTGEAETGTNVELIAHQIGVPADMGPGDSAQTLSGDFENNSDGPVYVTSVTATIASVEKALGAPAGTCDASDYTLASALMLVGAEVPVGLNEGAWTGATIKFNNKVTNQDACKLATVTLAYTII